MPASLISHESECVCAGPQFWDQDFLAFTRLDRYPIVLEYIPRLGLNDAFMALGGVVLAFNIVTRWAVQRSAIIHTLTRLQLHQRLQGTGCE